MKHKHTAELAGKPKSPRLYSTIVRRTMVEKRLSRRDLAKATDYSYEHIRKIVNGLPLMSETFNYAICKALGLDPARMWDLASREKALARHGASSPALPRDERFRDAWEQLTLAEQARIVNIACAMADANRAARELEETSDPRVIRDRIQALLDRLPLPPKEKP